MPEIRLFHSPGSCSRISLIALEEIGTDYCAERVILAEGQQHTEAFRAINPKGRVPALMVDDKILTETIAIVTYLAHAFPMARLLPTTDDWTEINALALLSWCATGFHPLITRLRHPQKYCGLAEALDDVRNLARTELCRQLRIAELHLSVNSWIAPPEWTIVDAYIAWIWGRSAEAGIDPHEFPNIADHHARCMMRDSSLRAIAREMKV